MKRMCLTLFLIILFASPLAAQEAYRAQVPVLPVAFVAPLMDWVAQRMAVPVQTLPVVVVSRARMIEKIGDPLRQAARQAAMARALYVPGEVVIDDEFWNPEEPRTISFLVHELVHHAQLVSGRSYACQNAKEWEAYSLQNMWLAEHSLAPAVDQKWISSMSQCNHGGGYYH